MFMSLDEAVFEVVIDAMDEKKVQPNDFIIKEGEAGESIYVVESGELKCTKDIDGKETF